MDEEYKEIEEEENDSEDDLKEPFNPKDIDIVIEQRSLDSIIARIKHDEIDLNPEFQREGNLWSESVMSRLIESVLVRFPLPAFYFDASDDERWLVVDGLQRLYTFKRFVVECETEPGEEKDKKPLKLKGLEFLTDYEGKTFAELPHNMQRRLREAQITAYFIKPGTPREVKYSIFHRINTGGLILNAQEIRNALNQEGHAARYLKEVSALPIFKGVVNISPRRMQDRELILRHMAFRLHPYQGYKPSMKKFLNDAMEELNKRSREELDQLKTGFVSALELSRDLFGKRAFSKSLVNPKSSALNRGLFEVFTVLTADMPAEDKERLLNCKEEFLEAFKILLRETDFDSYITSATAGRKAVLERFNKAGELISRFTRK
jgi:hypothetical protein